MRNMTHSKDKIILIRDIIIVLLFILLLVLIIYFASARFSHDITGVGSAKIGKIILETRCREL